MLRQQFSSVLFAVFFISLSFYVNAGQREKIIEFHAECLDAHDVHLDKLIEALEGNPTNDQAFHNHIFCTCKKAGVINDEGIVNTDNIEIDLKDVIDPENMANVAALIRKCLVQKDDLMTTIKMGSECFFKEEHNLK